MDLWIEHLSAMTRAILQHSRNGHSVSDRTKSLLAYHQLEAGTSASFVSLLGTEKADCFTPPPLTHLLAGLKELGVCIWIPHWRPPPGETLIDIFLDLPVGNEELFKLNICRMASKVRYVTDLLTIDRAELLLGAAGASILCCLCHTPAATKVSSNAPAP